MCRPDGKFAIVLHLLTAVWIFLRLLICQTMAHVFPINVLTLKCNVAKLLNVAVACGLISFNICQFSALRLCDMKHEGT